jgi:hypothetical protein
MDIGCEKKSVKSRVEVYAIGGDNFRFFIFWIIGKLKIGHFNKLPNICKD